MENNAPFIIGACSIIGSFIGAIIGRYGLGFWKNWRTINVEGHSHYIGKMTPEGTKEFRTTIEEQKLTESFLKIRGKRVVLTGEYILRLTTGDVKVGKM